MLALLLLLVSAPSATGDMLAAARVPGQVPQAAIRMN